jgi:cell division protein FtsL
MLVAGQSVVKDKLQGAWFLLFWLVCVILTGLAMVTAIRDARALLRSNREEHRELIKSTIEKIESEARSRPGEDDKL